MTPAVHNVGVGALAFTLSQETSTDRTWTERERRSWGDDILDAGDPYPDQDALYQALSSGSASIAAHGTRRSAKSDTIARWCAAACTVRDRFTVRIWTQTLAAPTKNIFRRKSDGGLIGVMTECGLLPDVCTVRQAGNPPSIVSIEWPWGSSITVEDIGTPRAIGNKHGGSADVNWIDEVTKTPLAGFAITDLIGPTLGDSGGIIVLSFTPDDNLDSLPARIAAGEDTGYESHWFRSWRNPFFGPSFSDRWGKLCDGIERARGDYMLSSDDMAQLRGLSEADLDAIALDSPPESLASWVNELHPQLQVNWFGRWIRVAGSYVYYPFHKLASDALYWCATDDHHSRRRDGIALPIATEWGDRLELLPTWEWVQPIEWRAVIAIDIGHDPSAYAEVVKLWAPHYPTIFELESFKAKRLDDTEMFERACDLVRRVGQLSYQGRDIRISRIVADLTGMMVPVKKGWDRRLKKRYPVLGRVGVRAPKKPQLVGRRIGHNLDLGNGRLRYIAGNPIDVESRHLRYRKDKPAEIDLRREVVQFGKMVAHRNDALTAGMYADLEINNLNPKPPPGARRRGVPVYA